MNCIICGKESNEAFLRLGGYCSEEHRLKILSRHNRALEELRREKVDLMPEVFSLADFERFALKLAVHLLEGISKTARHLYRLTMPEMLDPLEVAQNIKELILTQLPDTHVERKPAQGLAQLFCSGTYTFKQPVLASLIVEAISKTYLLPILRKARS